MMPSEVLYASGKCRADRPGQSFQTGNPRRTPQYTCNSARQAMFPLRLTPGTRLRLDTDFRGSDLTRCRPLARGPARGCESPIIEPCMNNARLVIVLPLPLGTCCGLIQRLLLLRASACSLLSSECNAVGARDVSVYGTPAVSAIRTTYLTADALPASRSCSAP